jgi:hypothetical protein
MRASLRLVVLSAAIFLPLCAVAAAEGSTGFQWTLPPNIVAEATSPNGATVAYTAGATYDGQAAKVVCTPASGTIFPLGQVVVGCKAKATDHDHTVSASASFTVLVRDTTPPVLHLPVPAVLHTNRITGLPSSNHAIAAFLVQASASDVVDGSDAVTSDAPAIFRFGKRTITFTAVDRAGNRAVATTSLDLVLDSARNLHAPVAGAVLTSPPVLRWLRVKRAAFYNVQLWRGSTKILSAWPSGTKLRLHARWRYHGKLRQLTAGIYTWYVWPGYGSKASVRYGKLVGASTFIVG